MPPSISLGRGRAALAFLEANDIHLVTPTIRSRDWGLQGAPLLYYLIRRLGIRSLFSYSEAKNLGSWFHHFLEFCFLPPDDANIKIHTLLNHRLKELTDLCHTLGIAPQKFVDRERKDFLNAKTWWEATYKLNINPDTGTLHDFLNLPHWRVLGHEVLASYLDRRFPGVPLVAQYDILLYHELQNSVWIFDAKTTAYDPVTRLSTCSVSFQTWHYIWVLELFRRSGILQKVYNLPLDVRVGGMTHFAIQKPTIKMAQKDRAFRLDETPFKSGPRRGQPRNERKYYGEPTTENYLRRCMEWFMGTGEYAHLSEERSAVRPVNLSHVSASFVLDRAVQNEYDTCLRTIHELATIEPLPEYFPRANDNLLSFGSLNPYTPFHVCPVEDWPSIIEKEYFTTDPDPSAPTKPSLTNH